MSEAHFVSKYSNSGLVWPVSHCVVGRNVCGPAVWQAQRCQRGLGTATGPKTVCTVLRRGSLLRRGFPHELQGRCCSRYAAACCATTYVWTVATRALPSASVNPNVSIVI